MTTSLLIPHLPESGVSFESTIPGLQKFWLMVLSMSVRDEANTVRWYPWETGHYLAYTVGAAQYGLLVPPETLSALAFEAAQQLISPGLGGWLARRFLNSGTGVLECSSEKYGSSTWCGLWWRQGAATGVQFVRLDRFPVLEKEGSPHFTEEDAKAYVINHPTS